MVPSELPLLPALDSMPTTIHRALQPSREACVITEATKPNRIVHVNDTWSRVCGFSAEEAIGQTCALLQGFGTCKATLGQLRDAVLQGQTFAVQLLNYRKGGQPFMNTLTVAPLRESEHGPVTHYFGVIIARFLAPAPVPEPAPVAVPAPIRELVPGSVPPQTAAAAASSTQHAAPRAAPFLTKLCEILSTEPAHLIRLSTTAATFEIVDAENFAKTVLPRYFKHNKLGSFSQQLHTYGFRRTVPARAGVVEYHHIRYAGEPSRFLAWVRSGGAQAKPAATPEPEEEAELLADIMKVHEGIRQIGMIHAEAKLTHSVQMRTILTTLVRRGLLAPESATYVALLPPATPILLTSPAAPDIGTSQPAPMPTSVDSVTYEGLLAQIDALDALEGTEAGLLGCGATDPRGARSHSFDFQMHSLFSSGAYY